MKSVGVRAASRTPLRADATARLELLEQYLEQPEDLGRCIQASLEWLARRAGVRRSVCLVVDGDGTHLVGVDGYGVSHEEVELFSWPLTDTRDPLVRVLLTGQPAVFRASRTNGDAHIPSTPLRTSGFLALPLPAGRGEDADAVGLLLVRPTTPVTPDLTWLLMVLGQRIDQIRGRGGAAQEARRLHRERTLFYTIINSVTDPILLTDTEGRLIVANVRAEKLFAATEDANEGRQRAVELNNMLFSAALSRTVVEAPSEARELLLVDPGDGSDLLFEVLSSTVEDPREGTGIVSVLRNVTDLRRATEQIEENYQKLRVAEAAVRAERDRLNLIIDSVADPIIVTDPGGATVLMNAPAGELFTAPAEAAAIVQRSVQSNDAHFSSFISGLLLGETGPGEVRRGEIALINPQSGTSIPVEAIAGKVLGESGELTAVVTILHDRREALERARLFEQLKLGADELQMRVQAATAELATQNELLRRQAIELEQASRLKSQFMANMSHEFRTPLNAILGYTHMLLQGVAGELTSNIDRQLRRIDSNARNLLKIINEILDITRIEAGTMPMQIGQVDLNAVVPEVMMELDAVIIRSRLSVVTTLAPHPIVIHTDRLKVKQIIVNLLSNALKFTHEGEITVSVEASAAGKTASVVVTDTGIGISPEHHESIFDDFRQVDESSSREFGGTGLGLAICRRLAHALGGRISLHSGLGKGSTFTLTIPVDAPQ